MKYEKFDQIEHALSSLAVELAGAKCGYNRPTLYVHQDTFGIAESIAKRLYYNLEADDSLSPTEYYVKWGDKAFGSLGC